MTRYGVFRTEDAKRIARATRAVEGAPGTFVRIPERIPRIVGGSSAAETCPEVHELSTTGSPTSGTADLTYIIGSSDTVTINYDDTAAEIVTAMETHAGVASGDVACTGGPLPAVAIYIIFRNNLANTVFALPSISDSISGGDLRVRKAASYDWTS